MKLKPYKERIKLNKIIGEIFGNSYDAAPMSIGIDTNGCVTLENFKRMIDCRQDVMAVQTKDKTVYIYGENLVMTDCNKYSAKVFGTVVKVEIFPTEVS